MPTVIHTSDSHLGAPLAWMGKGAAEQREQLKRTFAAVIDLAIDESASCLIIAGDLFDSNRPPASAVRFAIRELTRLTIDTEASIVLLPGSHDHLSENSVYTSYRDEFSQVAGLTVLGVSGETCARDERLGIAVHGQAPRSNRSSIHQLADLSPDPDIPFNIAVAHGSVTIVPGAEEDHPITQDELSAPGWAYFALGHWHSWREIKTDGAPAVYPGAPELMAADQGGSGHVAKIELRGSGARVSQVRVGARVVAEARTDVSDALDTADVVRRVIRDAPADPGAVLRLTLTGLLDVSSAFDEQELMDALADQYFAVCQPTMNYHVRLTDADLNDLPEHLVVGRFVRLMRERFEQAGADQERGEIEAALQLGVALLEGKDVLG